MGRGPTLAASVGTWPYPEAVRLVDSVYGALVLERLSMHAATVLGVEIAGVLVRDRMNPDSLVLVALHGADHDALGERYSVSPGSLHPPGCDARAGDRPSARPAPPPAGPPAP